MTAPPGKHVGIKAQMAPTCQVDSSCTRSLESEF